MARRDHDAYYTPTDAVHALMRRRPLIGKAGDVVVEPCVGGGAIAQPFRDRGCLVITNDLVPTVEADVHDDAQIVATWRELQMKADVDRIVRDGHDSAIFSAIDWVVTNPPFVAARPILKQAIAHARLGVAFFLRLSFLEPTEERGDWLAAHPPDDLFVLPRISFTGDGKSDSVTCAWMVWYAEAWDYRAEREFARQGMYRRIEIVPDLDDPVETAQQDLWAV